MIDNLTYTYGDAARPDRLTNVVDAADAAKGFKYTAGAADYQYDLSGNLTQDNHKGFAFGYNYLNLPQSMTKGADVITMTYTADGEKLTKALTGGGATKSYVSGIEYSGTNLEAIYFSDGRCTPNGTSAFYYEYTVKDHLGNARVSFQANGASLTPLQENHYYPFGLEMEGSWIAQVGTENPYQYNGKELNEDFGLNLSDYGARWYDASLGRWWSVDPMAEDLEQAPFSPYHYTFDNPVLFIDPDGMKGTNEYVFDSEKGKTVLVGDKVDDHVFLDQKGSEVGRIVDPNVKLVSIVDWHAPQKLPSTKEELLASAKVTYEIKGLEKVFKESSKEINSSMSPYDGATGKDRNDIANEKGASLIEVNGVANVDRKSIVPGSPQHTAPETPSNNNNYVAIMHTHPNEGKGLTRFYDGTNSKFSDNGPSIHDRNNSPSTKNGYYNVVIDKNNIYFYNNKSVISINRSKL